VDPQRAGRDLVGLEPLVAGSARELVQVRAIPPECALGELPPVTEMALEADKHWPPLIEGLHPEGHPLPARPRRR
jgi:hypothetical protein